jgi:glycine/D-amino acid oxidase-like deaminating enzyme
VQAGSTNDDRTTPWSSGSWPQPVPAGGLGATEVIVAGAGIAGLVIAVGLAEAGARVAVVDPAPGEGAAGRGAGMVVSGLAEHPARLAYALGIERAAALIELGRRSVARLEQLGVSLTRCDQVWVATAPEEAVWIERSVAALGQMGVAAERLDADGLAARGVRGAVGFVAPGDALVDDPAEALARLAQRAAGLGVAFVAGRAEEVVATGPSAGVAAVVDGARLAAEVVVWAAGHGHGEPGLAPLLWPVREHAQVVAVGRPLPPGVGRAGHGWTGFRPLPDGRALVTGCRWATAHLEVGEREAVTVEAVQDRLGAFAAAHLGAQGPPISSGGPTPGMRRWAWITAHSCDGLPLVGPMPGDPRTLVCAGFGGNDWGLGPAAATLLVDGLVGSATAPVPWLAPGRMA